MVGIIGAILFFVGILLMIVAWIWGMVLAFQDDMTWGLLCLIPFVFIIFAIKRRNKKAVQAGFLITVIGFLSAMIGFVISIFVLDSRANTPDQVPSESAEEPMQLDDSPEENLAGSTPETEATTQSGESLDETAIAPQSTEAPAAQSNSSSGSYHDTMMLGYRAYGEGDYQTALINFRRALEMQPGDQLANEAIENTEAAIAAN